MIRTSLKDRCISIMSRFVRPVNLFDCILLAFTTTWLITNFPMDLISAAGPATGGDTGSHYWPLQLLIDYGPFSGRLRIWNPANMVGEPSLVHYFPLPFYLMYALSAFLPAHIAFNIGTALPIIALPITAFVAMRLFNCRRPIPVLVAIGTLICLYNGAYSAWGGNFRSNLAGQFCHQYALIFLLLTLARFFHELKTDKSQVASALLAAATCLSHAYVALALPPGILAIIVFARPLALRMRLLATLKVGCLTTGLIIWWLWPSLDNNKWTTPYADAWVKNLKLSEIIPPRYWIAGAFLLLLFPTFQVISSLGRRQIREWPQITLFICLAFFYTAMIWVLPKIGLVDIRALPQIYMFSVGVLMILVGHLILKLKYQWLTNACVLLTAALIFYSTLEERKTIGHWTQWNYSSWNTKPPYRDLQDLSRSLSGNFSEPRIIYEHNLKSNTVGTERVFEMSPYFMGRSTLESLYMQSTLLAIQVFHLQALVSEKPSCPIPGMKCPKPDLARLRAYLQLYAVKDLILSSETLLNLAKKESWLLARGKFNMWHTYKNTDPISYVSLPQRFKLIDHELWRQQFLDWHYDYTGDRPQWLVSDYKLDKNLRDRLNKGDLTSVDSSNCQPQLTIDVSRIELTTACPGKAHLIKVSYHDSWIADNGSDIMLVSPGMLGIVPKTNKTVLRFGQKPSWKLSSYVSLLFMILCVFLIWRSHKARKTLLKLAAEAATSFHLRQA